MPRHFAISPALRTDLRPMLAASALGILWGLAPLPSQTYAAEPPATTPAQKTDTPTPSEEATVNTTPVGSWLLEDLGGGGVIDRVRTELTLDSDGRLSGSGGCNRFMGDGKLDGKTLTIGPLAGTRMACPPAVMEQEDRFLKTLEKVQGWRVDTAQKKLHLLDGSGETLLIFSATTLQK